MKYRVSPEDRWSFWENYTVKNADGVVIDLEFCCKYGSVIVDVPDDFEFEEEFNSEEFPEGSYEIEETGDENLEDWDIFGIDDEEEEQKLREELEEQYDPESDDYYDFREYLELNGWEFESYRIFIPKITIEPYEDE